KGDHGWANHLELIYGLTPDWAMTVVTPYQFGEENKPSGFGDLILRTKYRFFRNDMRGASSQAALHAGIKFPTGDADKSLGSGTTDFFVGASFGYESRRHYFFTGARFHRNGIHTGLDRGDAVRFNLAYGIRPWQLEYQQPDPVFIVEVNGSILGKNRSNKMKQTISLKTILASFALALMISTTLFADQKQVNVRIDGLSCPFCAFGLEKKLKSIEGVEKLEIKINDGLAILTFEDGAKVDEKLIIKKIKEAGFTPGEIKIGSKMEKKMETTGKAKISLNVKGMSCEGCSSRVTKALEKIGCVQDVDVDLKAGKATFICNDSKFDKDKFVQTVNGLGFKAELENK
ncbi:MAG: cation transporter, partial [bacterium]